MTMRSAAGIPSDRNHRRVVAPLATPAIVAMGKPKMRKMAKTWEESGVDDEYYHPNKPKPLFTALLSRKS